MSVAETSPLQAFQWTPQPQAERFIRSIVAEFLGRCPGSNTLAKRMKHETGTRFYDWVETIFLPDSDSVRATLAEVGYAHYCDRAGEHADIFAQAHGMFPRIVLHDEPQTAIHLKVTSVADCAAALGVHAKIEGEPLAPYRRVRIFHGETTQLWAAERWGWTGYDVPPPSPAQEIAAAKVLETLKLRRRNFQNPDEGFDHAIKLIESSPLNIDHTCAIFFEAERDFWQRRNRAAQVQKARQDRLGLGWGNHDHHTYRSSRKHFQRLVQVWERLGFECRERFYAGKEAGWGAQVMEQPHTGIITFNDVDLSPEELMGDFSHEGLLPREKLGTVGLWCALHGEAFLEAGMHHLEAQFDFESLRHQLDEAGVKTMKPFTNFSYLRQAFTEGERWPVREERIERLLRAGQITPAQADDFHQHGAIGSHLENLERNEGFKGFNQTGVSEIIAATDPRKHVQPAGH
jgi:hypothetical protein